MTRPEARTQGTRLPLSYNQELLCMFDSGSTSGPFGPRYHIVTARRITGPLDVGTLRKSLTDLVRRHEPLRTNIIRSGADRCQQVFPASAPRLELRECLGLSPRERDLRAESLLAEMESGLIEAEELPHLRAVLVRFDERDAALALVAHHTAADGWSMGVLARDLFAFYTAHRAGTAPALPPMRPYRDFVEWERERAASRSTAQARKWWEETLRGARLTALPADHPKSAELPQATAAYRFDIGTELLDRVRRLANTAGCSPFMALLAAYYDLVHRITGETDIVVPTHTLNRPIGPFDNTVGSFFNFLPLRVDLSGCRDVRDLITRVRAACVGAYEHEIPAVQVFEAAPDLMAPAMADHLTPVTFQALPPMLKPRPTRVGDLTYAVVPWQAVTAPVTSDIPDGAVWSISLDPAAGLSGDLSYRTNRFDEHTIVRLADDYRDSLERLVAEDRQPSVRPTVAP